MKPKRCYICNEIHSRKSRFCSRFCYEWFKKYFKKKNKRKGIKHYENIRDKVTKR